MPSDNTLLHGTLESLILKTLSHGPRHGYSIARWIEDRTSDALRVEEGSLYPALYRMERRGLVASEWGVSDAGRRAKVYRVTAKGSRRLVESIDAWSEFSAAVSELLLE